MRGVYSLKSKNWGFPEKEFLKTVTQNLPEFPDCRPAFRDLRLKTETSTLNFQPASLPWFYLSKEPWYMTKLHK